MQGGARESACTRGCVREHHRVPFSEGSQSIVGVYPGTPPEGTHPLGEKSALTPKAPPSRIWKEFHWSIQLSESI